MRLFDELDRQVIIDIIEKYRAVFEIAKKLFMEGFTFEELQEITNSHSLPLYLAQECVLKT